MSSSSCHAATPLSEVTFCVLDLETTGTDPTWDDITEIGAIAVRRGERLGTFHTLVGPGHAGIDGVLPSLLGFIGDAVITGHNIAFDIRFLNAALARAERPLLVDDHAVDTMYLARALLRDETDDCRLGTLAERFQFEHRPCHRAFEDAAATVDLLHLLIERSSSFGVVALDDLCALAPLTGHKWASKLRLTAALPRLPGVYACLDDRGRAVWIAAAGDLRRDVRSLFTKTGSAVHASVLRDTFGWQVHHAASSIERAVIRQRLLHAYRPRAQRREVLGDAAAYVCLRATNGGARATVVRAPEAAGWHLGPVGSRAAATAAAAGLRRLATNGIDVISVMHRAAGDITPGNTTPGDTTPGDTTPGDVSGLDAAFDLLIDAAGDDPVECALARRDRDAVLHLVAEHRRIESARSFSGTFVADGHEVSVTAGLLDGAHLPTTTSPAPPRGVPLPADLLGEVLAIAAALAAQPQIGGHLTAVVSS